MTVETQKRRKRWPLWTTLAGLALVLAATFVPPMISIGRYKNRIAGLVSGSLGRPVQVSGVELRLLPWPSFVLSNLVVDEDPAYGAEPVLHADRVTTDVRLRSLWRGRLEISSISVDNASLNVVRIPGGRWNLDPLFRTAAARAGAAASKEAQDRRAPRLPYLQATESRINFKNGIEKLPFSIVNADVSFWEESPGDWRLRLRGQPARTDVSLFEEDTGIVRINASLHSAPSLREMPVHIDLDWSQAQLGQLSRLLTGSDPGWRGNLTAELHLDGTPETARVTARLRAAGVHRAEFAPAEPLDFDANCGFVYRYSGRALQDLVCDSPLGNGRIRVAGDLPGPNGRPEFTVALDRMPVAATLAFVRTIRSGVDPGLNASGSISGKLTYSEAAASAAPSPDPPANKRTGRRAAKPETPPSPLTGSFVVSGFQLSGGNLDRPIQVHHIILEPDASAPAGPLALAGQAEIPAGGPTPLSFTPRFTAGGYELSLRGPASMANVRQLTRLAGFSKLAQLDAIKSGPIAIDLDAQGPWLPPQPAELTPPQPATPNQPLLSASLDPPDPSADRLAGTIVLRDAAWKPDFLARSVTISQATLHLDGAGVRWDPVNLTYGSLKAGASLALPASCPGQERCPAHFELQFENLDAGQLQSAILGARPDTSLLDALIDRLHLSSAPSWPALEGTVKAASLKLGPVTLDHPSAILDITSTGAKITSLDAAILGGKVNASGSFARPDTDQGRPAYALDATFTGLSAAAAGKLLGMRWSGGPIDANGHIELSGITADELAASAKGALHFDWRRGTIDSAPAPLRPLAGIETGKFSRPIEGDSVPKQLARFTELTGDAEIGGNKITLKKCESFFGLRPRPVDAQITLGDPPTIDFSPPAAPPAHPQAQPGTAQSAHN